MFSQTHNAASGPKRRTPRPISGGLLLFAAAAVVLLIHPAIWLVNSWTDPSYDSSGFFVFAVAAGLFLWSLTSPLRGETTAARTDMALVLLAVSALVRLASQVLAINIVGAACLVLDVYAIGVLCRLPQRARAVSPTWLAVVFAFSLPLERVLQRTIGYALQEISARGACEVLSVFYGDLVCRGVRLIVNGTDVLVDLPCSGARALLMGLLGFAIAAALRRPSPRWVAIGAAATLIATGFGNVLRISVLAAGIAEPASFGGVNVMEQPWHDLIGLGALTIPCLTLFGWAVWSKPPAAGPQDPPAPEKVFSFQRGRPGLLAGAAALGIALVIVNLPRSPVDVSEVPGEIRLPLVLDGHARKPVPLSDREAAYFTRYGGWAAKAEYGAMGLLVTRTASPLRHLHAPEDCLRGLGFEVAYLGAIFEPLPTAVYRAIAPDGARYRIEVSFVPDRGEATYNVATAVWRWLNGEARSWTAVQRITPESLNPDAQAQFTRAVVAAMDLATPDASPNWKG